MESPSSLMVLRSSHSIHNLIRLTRFPANDRMMPRAAGSSEVADRFSAHVLGAENSNRFSGNSLDGENSLRTALVAAQQANVY